MDYDTKWTGLARDVLPMGPMTGRGPRAHWREGAVLLIGLVLVAGYAAARALDARHEALDAAATLGVPCVAALAAWVARFRQRLPDSLAWTGLAGGMTFWALAGFAGMPSSAPGQVSWVSTALFSAAALCWLGALFYMSRQTRPRPEITLVLDAVLVVVCGITLAGQFLIEPILRHASSAPLLLFHTLIVLILFAALNAFRYTMPGGLPLPYALGVGGLLAVLVGQGWQIRALAESEVGPAPGAAIAGMAAGLLFLASAHRALFAPAETVLVDRWGTLAAWMPLGYLVAVVILPVLSYTGQHLSDAVLTGVILSLSLAVVRLGLALRENQELRQERLSLRSQNATYARLAICDGLTGLFNKAYFEHRLKSEFDRSQRYTQALSIITLDLDNFKGVNDRYGHAAGDSLLVEVGRVLHDSVRTVDIACRSGGDEFVIILPHTEMAAGALLADRLRAAVVAILRRRGLHPYVSVSAGVAGSPVAVGSADELLARADAALYQAKHAGKNRTATWTATGPPAPRAS